MLNKLRFALPLAIALGVGLTLPAMAQSHYYEPSDNGSVWSDYPGYTDHLGTPSRHVQRHGAARDAFAQSPSLSRRSSGRVDDPPGSLFQDRENDYSMGCPC
jgi:hypothetical protein